METILVIEDKESMAQMLRQTLEGEGYRVLTAKDGEEGLKQFGGERVDLVLTDLKLPRKDGLEVLRGVREADPFVPVIVMTAFGTIETAVAAVKDGAFDFLTKPFDTGHLLVLIQRALEGVRARRENLILKEEFREQLGLPTIVGKSEALQEVIRQIRKAAPTTATVLLLGESGTGKELFARALHHMSLRKTGPFVALNCAAIPRDLLESELFGHERGAFTDAKERKLGRFELAHGGTLFLDEIGEMDLALQSKLLRALEGHAIERVGGTKPITIDVRIVAASNRDLGQAVQAKQLREDLYYRLSVLPVRIPPLRERREDIPLLVDHFLDKFGRETKRGAMTLAPETLQALMQHPWKGNVRELENCIERAVILSEGVVIRPETLGLGPSESAEAHPQEPHLQGGLHETASAAVRAAETRMIKKVLAETKGNKSRAAEILQVSYKTLLTKIKEYGLE
jgi:DNA-binding NtrC family response regulator